MQPSVLAKRAWFLLFAAIAAFYLWGLGSLPLVGPDEPRYAEVAREMLARRDLITPTLGGLPWFEKPPLLYWMMMLSYRLLGVTEYAARLGPAICGLLTTVFVYWIGKSLSSNGGVPGSGQRATAGSADILVRNFNDLADWSALVWLSSAGAIAFSRGASFDIVLTMTTTGALASFFVAENRARSQRHTACGLLASLSGIFQSSNQIIVLGAFYVFAGLSLLGKGLIGFVIIFGVIALYYIVRREKPTRAFAISLPWGVPLSLIVAGVWYGPMIARHGWTFIYQFIIQHHFARFATNKYHHPGPIYFYLPVIIGLALPWTIVLIAALISSRRWKWRGEAPVDRLRVFALVWLIFPMLFFSFSGSKLTSYILPVLPAAALLVGERIVCLLNAQRGDKVMRLTGAGLVGLTLAGLWYSHHKFRLPLGWSVVAALPLILVGATALLRPQLRKPLFLLIAIATILSLAISLKWIAPVSAKAESVRDLLNTAAARGYATTPVVQLHNIERTAEFYAANRLTYGSDGEPVKFEGAGQVMEAARRSGVVLCFVPIEFEPQLTADKHLQTEMIGNNGRVALLAVRLR